VARWRCAVCGNAVGPMDGLLTDVCPICGAVRGQTPAPQFAVDANGYVFMEGVLGPRGTRRKLFRIVRIDGACSVEFWDRDAKAACTVTLEELENLVEEFCSI